MKVLLINPAIREWAKPNIVPLGLGYLASVLRGGGHEVEIMDINAYRWSREEVEQRIKSADFDVAGIGGIVTVYKYVKWLAGVIKKHHGGKKLVVGGSVGTSIPHIILAKTAADVVCIGEGEVTILELMDAFAGKRELASVNGIWFRGKGGVAQATKPRSPIEDTDTLPHPSTIAPDLVMLASPAMREHGLIYDCASKRFLSPRTPA